MVKAKELRDEIERLKDIPLCNRTQEQHSKLMKSFKGSKNYIDSILKNTLHNINLISNWSNDCPFKKQVRNAIMNVRNNDEFCVTSETGGKVQ